MRIVLLFCLAAFATAGCATETKTIRINSGTRPPAWMHTPLPGARLLSPFGRRGDGFHTGVDIKDAARGGDVVRAAAAGRVTRAGTMRGYGNIVSIRHVGGWISRYAHLRTIRVAAGNKVAPGHIVGTVGQTGRASTPHLHFEVMTPSGRFIDPLIVVQRGWK